MREANGKWAECTTQMSSGGRKVPRNLRSAMRPDGGDSDGTAEPSNEYTEAPEYQRRVRKRHWCGSFEGRARSRGGPCSPEPDGTLEPGW